METARRHAWFSGTVQGVGFRFTARRLAERHRVSGFVKNLPDGRVEVVAEGPADDVQAFLGDVREAMASTIRDAEIEDESPTGEFDGFGVAF
ncbi:MAG: acylphosphatase [Phycisphaerae bacterium]